MRKKLGSIFIVFILMNLTSLLSLSATDLTKTFFNLYSFQTLTAFETNVTYNAEKEDVKNIRLHIKSDDADVDKYYTKSVDENGYAYFSYQISDVIESGKNYYVTTEAQLSDGTWYTGKDIFSSILNDSGSILFEENGKVMKYSYEVSEGNRVDLDVKEDEGLSSEITKFRIHGDSGIEYQVESDNASTIRFCIGDIYFTYTGLDGTLDSDQKVHLKSFLPDEGTYKIDVKVASPGGQLIDSDVSYGSSVHSDKLVSESREYDFNKDNSTLEINNIDMKQYNDMKEWKLLDQDATDSSDYDVPAAGPIVEGNGHAEIVNSSTENIEYWLGKIYLTNEAGTSYRYSVKPREDVEGYADDREDTDWHDYKYAKVHKQIALSSLPNGKYEVKMEVKNGETVLAPLTTSNAEVYENVQKVTGADGRLYQTYTEGDDHHLIVEISEETPVPEEKLKVTKDVIDMGNQNEVASPGEQLLYIISVTNKSANDIKNVVVNDKVNEEHNLDSLGSFTIRGSVQGDIKNKVIYDTEKVAIPTIKAGEQITITFKVNAADDLTSIPNITNEVTAIYSGTDYTADSTIPTTGTAAASPKLEITKDVAETKSDDNKASVGENLTYTIKVKNTGDANATNVKVEDTLNNQHDKASMSNLTVVGSSQGDITSTVTKAYPDITIPTVEVGETMTITFKVNTANTLSEADENVSNKATVTASNVNGSLSDTSLIPVFIPEEKATLEITKDVSETTSNDNVISADESMNYKITITNTSLADAINVEVIDNIDPATHNLATLSKITVNGSMQGNITPNGNVIPLIKAGETVTVSFTINASSTLKQGDIIQNTVTASAENVDETVTASSEILTSFEITENIRACAYNGEPLNIIIKMYELYGINIIPEGYTLQNGNQEIVAENGIDDFGKTYYADLELKNDATGEVIHVSMPYTWDDGKLEDLKVVNEKGKDLNSSSADVVDAITFKEKQRNVFCDNLKADTYYVDDTSHTTNSNYNYYDTWTYGADTIKVASDGDHQSDPVKSQKIKYTEIYYDSLSSSGDHPKLPIARIDYFKEGLFGNDNYNITYYTH